MGQSQQKHRESPLSLTGRCQEHPSEDVPCQRGPKEQMNAQRSIRDIPSPYICLDTFHVQNPGFPHYCQNSHFLSNPLFTRNLNGRSIPLDMRLLSHQASFIFSKWHPLFTTKAPTLHHKPTLHYVTINPLFTTSHSSNPLFTTSHSSNPLFTTNHPSNPLFTTKKIHSPQRHCLSTGPFGIYRATWD